MSCVPIFYFDGTHLWCADLDSLHSIAIQIGLKRAHFQDGKHPHYDVWGRPKKKLLMFENTKVVSPKELIRWMKPE